MLEHPPFIDFHRLQRSKKTAVACVFDIYKCLYRRIMPEELLPNSVSPKSTTLCESMARARGPNRPPGRQSKDREVKKRMSSRQNLYIYIYLGSCYCYGYRFWGALSLSRVCDVLWKSAHSRSNMKPKSIPKQARKWIEELFCWFQVLWQHFMFFSFCILLHAFLFIFLHVPFICMHVAFILQSFPHMFLAFSFHAPFICIHFLFMFLSFSFQCAFMSFYLRLLCTHFLFILHSCPFISFLKLWKWIYGLAREPSATNGYR